MTGKEKTNPRDAGMLKVQLSEAVVRAIEDLGQMQDSHDDVLRRILKLPAATGPRRSIKRRTEADGKA